MVDFFRELFQPEMSFLHLALVLGVLASPALGVIGTLVVTRRISSIAGAGAHAALGGVGIALYLQRVLLWSWCTATVGAIAGAVAAALLVGVVSLTAREREDTVIAVVWALGMSLGLLFLDKTPGYVDLQGFLFGNILLVTQNDLWMTLALDAVVVIPAVLFYNPLLATCFDGTFAVLRGVKTSLFYLVLLALTALTVVLLINVVGIVLVIALLTLPAAAAGCFTRHLWSMMVCSGILSAFFISAGLLLSTCFSLPSGPVIVLVAALVYVISLFIGSRRKSERGAAGGN
ncbi:MAG: metal ABC transporter permease [Lentisphaeria bacterium]|nr:metal ABC transporter permease [Lentisphaeria bacterium]